MENFEKYQSTIEMIQDDEERLIPRSITIIAGTCATLLSIFGIVGNLVTVVALLKCIRLRRDATTAFIISLSISDLIFSAVNLPLIASRYLNEAWVLGETLCQIFPLLLYGNTAVSLLSIVAITINRFVLIVKFEIYARVYTTQGITLMLIAIWVLSFSPLIPSLLGVWGTHGFNPATFSCTILSKDGKSPKKFLFIVGFIVPFIVIIISYLCIYWKLRKSRKNLEVHSDGRKKDSVQNREESKVTKVMLRIFLYFILCSMPITLVSVIDDKMRTPILHVIFSMLFWTSNVINPFIYVGTNKLYRQAYRQVLCPTSCKARVSDVEPTNC